MMEPTGEMSSEQIGAIEHSIRIGSLLVIDHPEIAELYRDGMTHSGIAEILDVKREYGILSDYVARNTIRYAITGHAGGFSTEPYDGLIQNLDELAELEHEHYAENGRKLAAEGKGAHGYNPKTGERYVVENGRKAVEDGTGIHGLTPEQRSEYSSKGGIKATLAKGQTPWEKEETEYAHLLSLEPEFQHQKGKHKGKGDYKTIAQVLNVDYHNGEEVRSAMAIQVNLSNYRKTLGN